MRYNPPPLLRLNLGLIAAAGLLFWIARILRDVTNDLGNQAFEIGRSSPDVAFELRAWAFQVDTIRVNTAILGVVIGGAVIVLSMVQLAWLFGLRPARPDDQLSEALQHLIDGLADAEQRAADSERRASRSTEQAAKMRDEHERLQSLATLSPDQLQAIERTVSPGARVSLILGLGGIVVGLIAAFVASWLAGDLPWQH